MCGAAPYAFCILLKDREGCRIGFASDDFRLRKTQTKITGGDALISPDIKNTARRGRIGQGVINFFSKTSFSTKFVLVSLRRSNSSFLPSFEIATGFSGA